MVKFGTTAKLMNISVEESVGLIETLGEKAIFGADAGTALRNILLKMGSIDVLPQKALKQLEKYGVDTSIVKDTTLSLEERLLELSKVAKDSTAIMQIFGTENATAATVLLNSLGTYDKMTDAVTGTNVAQEQAAINSDTLTAVIGELRAAWENLVIKWSEGTDVAGGLKAVLRFLADNLEIIVKTVFTGIKAWAAYRIALMLWNKEGKGLIPTLIAMGTNLGNSMKGVKGLTGAMKGLGAAMKTIPFAGWVSILVTLVPLVWDLADSLFGAEDGAKELTLAEQSLNNVTKKTAERLIEEEAELTRVFEALKNTKAGTEARQTALDEVNKKYGLTLQNLSDEGEFVRQLDTAYNDLIRTLEKKIMQEVTLEEQTALIKSRLKLQKELATLEKDALLQSAEVNKTFQDFNAQDNTGIGRSAVETRILSIKDQIKGINDALAALNTQDVPILSGGDTGGGANGGGSSSAKKQEYALSKLRRENAEELIALENQLLQSGLDKELVDQRIFEQRLLQYNEEFEMIERLNYGEAEYNKTLNERLKLTQENVKFLKKATIETIENNNKIKDSEKDKFDYMAEIYKKYADEQAKKQTEIIKGIQDSIKQALDAISEMLQANESLMDIQIEKQQTILDASISKETELRDIARERNLDASESINAEREIQKKARREIEALEQKKRNLEMMIAAMKLLADGSSVGDIKSKLADIKGFIEGSFYEGTPYTIADALGHTGTRDGHIVRVDDNEAVLTGDQTRALGIGKGGNSTQDIVDMFKNLGQPAVMKMRPTIQNNGALERKLDRLIEATVSIPSKMPVNDTTFDTMGGYMHWTKKQKLRTERIKYSAK